MAFLENISGEIGEWSMSTLFSVIDSKKIDSLGKFEAHFHAQPTLTIPLLSCESLEQYNESFDSLNTVLSNLEEVLLPVAYDIKINAEELACLGLKQLPLLTKPEAIVKSCKNISPTRQSKVSNKTQNLLPPSLSLPSKRNDDSYHSIPLSDISFVEPISLVYKRKEILEDFKNLLVNLKRKRSKKTSIYPNENRTPEYSRVESNLPKHSFPQFIPLRSSIPVSSSRTPILATPFYPVNAHRKSYKPRIPLTLKLKIISNLEKLKLYSRFRSSNEEENHKFQPQSKIKCRISKMLRLFKNLKSPIKFQT
ncbi:hypothetical protein HMI54_012565 [Coelomomyces lativittatus]|nr:hypothetical protein HMI55_003435 [Coelomomyces lativittatus]KAJ1512122.1 hypothetical protein HMI56_004489 [Coelomomyces lativittatus]KAJ1515297.1 hypothetical protein HMI54_012565 [Coelomomyces lativittatus]